MRTPKRRERFLYAYLIAGTMVLLSLLVTAVLARSDDPHAIVPQTLAWMLGAAPFALLLLAIATLPLLKSTAHWWESNTQYFI